MKGLTREGLDSIASEGRLGAVLVQFPGLIREC